MTQETFWTFHREDKEICDAEYPTAQKAMEEADEQFADECLNRDYDWQNNETDSEGVVLINFYYDEDTGDRVIIKRVNETVDFEYYHGDQKEHGTW